MQVGATPRASQLEGFENISANLNRSRIIGNSAPNRLTVADYKCHISLAGLGGNDILRVSSKSKCADVTDLNGGAGDDRLYGGSGRDSLIGGAGRDYAKGDGNRDTCVAEVERSCER
jgi:Ca2+-binding RTX toxin-like protein